MQKTHLPTSLHPQMNLLCCWVWGSPFFTYVYWGALIVYSMAIVAHCLSHHALLSLAQMVNDTTGCDPCTMHYAMAKIAHCPSHHVLPSLGRMVSDMAVLELDKITCAVILYGVMLLHSLWLLCNTSWRVSSMIRLWAKYLQATVHYCSLYWAVMHVTMQPRQI